MHHAQEEYIKKVMEDKHKDQRDGLIRDGYKFPCEEVTENDYKGEYAYYGVDFHAVHGANEHVLYASPYSGESDDENTVIREVKKYNPKNSNLSADLKNIRIYFKKSNMNFSQFDKILDEIKDKKWHIDEDFGFVIFPEHVSDDE